MKYPITGVPLVMHNFLSSKKYVFPKFYPHLNESLTKKTNFKVAQKSITKWHRNFKLAHNTPSK